MSCTACRYGTSFGAITGTMRWVHRSGATSLTSTFVCSGRRSARSGASKRNANGGAARCRAAVEMLGRCMFADGCCAPAYLIAMTTSREETSLREREAQVRRLRESQTRSADSQLQRVKHDESVRVFKTLLTELVRNHEVAASPGRRSVTSPCVALKIWVGRASDHGHECRYPSPRS